MQFKNMQVDTTEYVCLKGICLFKTQAGGSVLATPLGSTSESDNGQDSQFRKPSLRCKIKRKARCCNMRTWCT